MGTLLQMLLGEKGISPRGAALILNILRRACCLALILWLAFAFVGSLEFSGLQGFGPDGPPPGFKPIPALLFALLFTPILLFDMATSFPWLAIPVVAGTASELFWRVQSPETRLRWNEALARHTAGVVGALALGLAAWTAVWLYAYRTGPAEFCVQNYSSKILDHVIWQADTGTINVGRMLPLERRYYTYLPKSSREDVHLAFTVNGVPHRVDFIGDIGNSREYYYQYGVRDDLRGELGAWTPPWFPPTSVTVYNDSTRELHNVEINGLGWQLSTPTLAPNQSLSGTVSPKGPLIHAMSFEVDGKRHAYNLWDGGGLTGPITVRIPPNLKVPALGMWQPSPN